MKLLGFLFYQTKCHGKGSEVSWKDTQLFKPHPSNIRPNVEIITTLSYWIETWVEAKFQLVQYFLILHSDVHKQSYWKKVSSHVQFQKESIVRSIYCNWKKSTGSVYDNERFIQWLPITRTLTNSNLALTQTKTDFPWIFVVHLL